MKRLPLNMTTSGKKSFDILYAKQPMENHKGPTPDEKTYRVKRITLFLPFLSAHKSVECAC